VYIFTSWNRLDLKYVHTPLVHGTTQLKLMY